MSILFLLRNYKGNPRHIRCCKVYPCWKYARLVFQKNRNKVLCGQIMFFSSKNVRHCPNWNLCSWRNHLKRIRIWATFYWPLIEGRRASFLSLNLNIDHYHYDKLRNNSNMFYYVHKLLHTYATEQTWFDRDVKNREKCKEKKI